MSRPDLEPVRESVGYAKDRLLEALRKARAAGAPKKIIRALEKLTAQAEALQTTM